MGTVITVIIGALLSVSLLLRDTLPKRKLMGANPREYFSHPFDYELGARLVFIKLPKIPYLGSLVTPILFFLLLVYVPAIIGSSLDGVLFAQSLKVDVAFFEESIPLGGAIVAGVMCYLYRRVFEYVPHGMVSVAKSRNTQDGSYTISPEAKAQLKSTASFIFQAGNGRRRSWLLFDILLGIALICMVAYAQLGKLWAEPGVSMYGDPAYLWSNIVTILGWFIYVYFIRLLLSYVIRLIIAMRSIGKTLDRKNLLHIEPLHPDGAGGLAEFGNLAGRIGLLILPIALFLLFWWYDRILPETRVDFFFIVAGIAVIVMIPVFFFVPLWGLHTAMAKAKKRALDVLSRHFDDNAAAMWKCLEDEESITREEGSSARENIENISTLYEHVSKMPVWPFNTTTIVRLGGYMLIVVVPLLLQKFSGP
jgi:ABC-type multidrug transport system fused ATPase/permease subunit